MNRKQPQKQEVMSVDAFRALMNQPMGKDNTSPSAPDDTLPNQKIKNAQKSERDGVKFDSGLERYMYDLMKIHKIEFTFQQVYTIQDGFMFNGQKVQPVTLTVDFEVPAIDWIIDTKGHQTQQSALRFKMLKKLLAASNRQTVIELPSIPAECDRVVSKMLDLLHE